MPKKKTKTPTKLNEDNRRANTNKNETQHSVDYERAVRRLDGGRVIRKAIGSGE